MESSAPARVLVVAAKTAATPALIDAVRERAARGPAVFTLLVPNPTHGLHTVVDPEDQDAGEAGGPSQPGVERHGHTETCRDEQQLGDDLGAGVFRLPYLEHRGRQQHTRQCGGHQAERPGPLQLLSPARRHLHAAAARVLQHAGE